MKFLMMFAASAVSAVLVLPTVTQAQSGSIHEQLSSVAGHADPAERRG